MRDQLNGVLVLDKPAGISSARAVAEVKKITGAAKVGHTGTLDPFATGVLLCCINQATRLARFFLHGDKRYEAVLRLGTATDTLDGTGEVVSRQTVPHMSAEQLETIFNRFRGQQMQQPPVYAALKHNGTPLYKLARQGKPVQKASRPVNISVLRIKAVDLPDVRFEMQCSAGTYVRVLCADIGRVIGCGGHLAELRRTASCGFAIEEALPLEKIQEMAKAARPGLLIPMADALRGLPAFQAEGDLLQHLAHGKRLSIDHIPVEAVEKEADAPLALVKVVDDARRLRAVLQWSPDNETYNYCCVFN